MLEGRSVKLNYYITGPAGLSPTADVTITIARSNGKAAKTLRMNDVPVHADQAMSLRCTLPKGNCKWSVYATDLAGNAQENVAQAKPTVK